MSNPHTDIEKYFEEKVPYVVLSLRWNLWHKQTKRIRQYVRIGHWWSFCSQQHFDDVWEADLEKHKQKENMIFN